MQFLPAFDPGSIFVDAVIPLNALSKDDLWAIHVQELLARMKVRLRKLVKWQNGSREDLYTPGFCMKNNSLRLLATLLLVAHPLRAQISDTPVAKGFTEDRLARALKMFPDADLDKDGKLTLDEALKYIEAHPELKPLINARALDRIDSKPAKTVEPGTRSTPASAGFPPGPRVFVCSHSFMIFTATQLPSLTQAAGIAWQDAGSQMIGGSRTIQHWNVPDEKNLAKKQLSACQVDVLTLSPHAILPDEGIDNFTKLGLEKNPKLRVLVQASWPARDGELMGFSNAKRDASTVESLAKMREIFETTWLHPLEAQVQALNLASGTEAVHIIPVCNAVFALRERVVRGTAPGITKQSELFRDDLGHPKPPLAALVSYCHFAAIHQRSPVGLPVPEELKSLPHAKEMNSLLQQLAWDAVTTYTLSGVGIVRGDHKP